MSMEKRENEFNLADEPWIPVIGSGGANRHASLMDIFTDESIIDLSLSPYERVAVLRLLLCIAQAALGEERLKNENDWFASKGAIGPESEKYLKKWRHKFYLYGENAFLQPDDIKPPRDNGGTSPRDKLIFTRASGNNSTLFDHKAVSFNGRELLDSELAIGILSYQSFSAGGTSSKCIWDGVCSKQHVEASPLREQSMLFSLILGVTILETVWLNLATAEWTNEKLRCAWGKPFWEYDSLKRSETTGNERTLLGHLVPFSRAIKLVKGAAECVLGEALQYPQLPEWREPMGSVKRVKGTKAGEYSDAYVSADPEKLPWRELSSILALSGRNGCKPALALSHINRIVQSPDETFSLWTGGLYGKKAKEVDVVEWRANLSAELLGDAAMLMYERAIELADKQEKKLHLATEKYAISLSCKEDKYIRPYTIPAERRYWDLLALPENQRMLFDVSAPDYLTRWRDAIYAAAEKAYDHACGRASPRQIEAYAKGLAALRKVKLEDNSKKKDDEQ